MKNYSCGNQEFTHLFSKVKENQFPRCYTVRFRFLPPQLKQQGVISIWCYFIVLTHMILYSYELNISRVATTLNILGKMKVVDTMSFLCYNVQSYGISSHLLAYNYPHKPTKVVTIYIQRRTHPYDHSLLLDYLTYASLAQLCHKILVTK